MMPEGTIRDGLFDRYILSYALEIEGEVSIKTLLAQSDEDAITLAYNWMRNLDLKPTYIALEKA